MRKQMLGWVAAPLALWAGAAYADADLVRKHNCAACHHNERKTVGPSFKDIAARYAADKGAAQMLAKRIQQGGVGAWGQMPMPPQPQVNEADALALAKYVLTIR